MGVPIRKAGDFEIVVDMLGMDAEEVTRFIDYMQFMRNRRMEQLAKSQSALNIKWLADDLAELDPAIKGAEKHLMIVMEVKEKFRA